MEREQVDQLTNPKGHYTIIALVDHYHGILEPEDDKALMYHCHNCRYCGSRLAVVILLRTGHEEEQRGKGKWWAFAIAVVIMTVVAGLLFREQLVQFLSYFFG